MKYRILIAALCCAFSFHSVAATNTHSKSRKDTPTTKTDPEKKEEPIEINADTLDVFQEKQQAIFSGNVKSVQGETHLNSDKMTVFYADKKNESDKTKKPASDEGFGNNSIQKIKAEGNVFLATPTETARGKWGLYNLETGIIDLYEDVTLTSGKNVITGDHLVHNRNTGKSRIVSTNSTEQSPGKKKRVKGVFVPEKKSE